MMTSICWSQNDVEDQSSRSSSVSSCIQPVIDAGKQRQATTADPPERRRPLLSRRPVGDLLFRCLNSASSPSTTVLSPPWTAPPKLLPPENKAQKFSRCSISGHWTCGDSTEKAVKTSGSGDSSNSVTTVADTSNYNSFCNDNEHSRRSSVQLDFPTRRSSEPENSRLTKSPSTASLDRRRPWISKHLQQFADAIDVPEKPVRRRRGSVAELVDNFEQCALQHGKQSNTPRVGRHYKTVHGSLKNLTSMGGARRWSESSGGASGDSTGSSTPVNPRNSITSPQFIDRPRLKSYTYSDYVKTLNTRNDQANHDVRRSSVGALHDSLTNLISVGRHRRYSTSCKQGVDDHRGSDRSKQPTAGPIITLAEAPTLTIQPRFKTHVEHIKTPKTRNYNAKLDNSETCHDSSRSDDDPTSVALCYSDANIIFSSTQEPPPQPYQQRRLSVLKGAKVTNSTVNVSTESTSVTADVREAGTVKQQEMSCDLGYDGLGPESISTSGQPTRRDGWAKETLAGIDNNGEFEPDFWKCGDTSLQRTGDAVSNSADGSGISSSVWTSSTVDRDRAHCGTGLSRCSARPQRSSLSITLSPAVSPPSHADVTPVSDDVLDHPAELLHDKSMRHVLHVTLDRGVAGLGFCIDGGKQSVTGDQPVTVKRIFRCFRLITYTILAASSTVNGRHELGETPARKHLREGDVILSANDQSMSEMTHYTAWNYLREIPDRVIHLVIARL